MAESTGYPRGAWVGGEPGLQAERERREDRKPSPSGPTTSKFPDEITSSSP